MSPLLWVLVIATGVAIGQVGGTLIMIAIQTVIE